MLTDQPIFPYRRAVVSRLRFDRWGVVYHCVYNDVHRQEEQASPPTDVAASGRDCNSNCNSRLDPNVTSVFKHQIRGLTQGKRRRQSGEVSNGGVHHEEQALIMTLPAPAASPSTDDSEKTPDQPMGKHKRTHETTEESVYQSSCFGCGKILHSCDDMCLKKYTAFGSLEVSQNTCSSPQCKLKAGENWLSFLGGDFSSVDSSGAKFTELISRNMAYSGSSE